MIAVDSRAQDQMRTGQWQLECTGGASVPVARFDEHTFGHFGGARTGVQLGVATYRKFSNSMTLGLGVHYFRFGSDFVGWYRPSPRTGEEHTASGEIFSVEPTWRWYIFSSSPGRNRAFLTFAPIVTWGKFTISHLYSPELIALGSDEVNADVDRDVALGTMFGAGVDIPILRGWLATVMTSYRHTPNTEANGPADRHHNYGYGTSGGNFNTSWVDFTIAVKRPL
jgi:hypothetical protein